jgi:hypothetical protein
MKTVPSGMECMNENKSVFLLSEQSAMPSFEPQKVIKRMHNFLFICQGNS